VGHHPQQPLLHPHALDQGLVLLAQHQQLVLQLQLAGAAAAIRLRRAQAQPQAAHHIQLLPAGQPAAQLLGHGAAGEHLLGGRLQLHQGGCRHQAVQLQQLGPLGRIHHLQLHLKAEVLALQQCHQLAQVRGGLLVGGGEQQQPQAAALLLRAIAQARLMAPHVLQGGIRRNRLRSGPSGPLRLGRLG